MGLGSPEPKCLLTYLSVTSNVSRIIPPTGLTEVFSALCEEDLPSASNTTLHENATKTAPATEPPAPALPLRGHDRQTSSINNNRHGQQQVLLYLSDYQSADRGAVQTVLDGVSLPEPVVDPPERAVSDADHRAQLRHEKATITKSSDVRNSDKIHKCKERNNNNG